LPRRRIYIERRVRGQERQTFADLGNRLLDGVRVDLQADERPADRSIGPVIERSRLDRDG
jgi:hypothetical protein